MIEAFLLGAYLLILSPILYWTGFDSPLLIFSLFLGLSLSGVYAMIIGAPFVPTQRKKVKQMLKLAKIDRESVVVDLGSGDGRFLFGASALGAKRVIGYELSLPLYLLTKIRSFFNSRVEVYFKNFWHEVEEISEAEVVICFLLVKPMQRFEVEIWPYLKSGTRVVSNVFSLPSMEKYQVHSKSGIKVYLKP